MQRTAEKGMGDLNPIQIVGDFFRRTAPDEQARRVGKGIDTRQDLRGVDRVGGGPG